VETPDRPPLPGESTSADLQSSDLRIKPISLAHAIADAKEAAIESAAGVLKNSAALVDAQKYIESLSKLEAASGVSRRRDIIHGAAILALVSLAVLLATGVKVGTAPTAASLTASELTATTTSVVVRNAGTYRNAYVHVGGEAGIDAETKQLLGRSSAKLTITEMQQTSELLNAVFRQGSGCQTLIVREGNLAVGLSSIATKDSATAVQVVLRGSSARPSSITLCGEMEQPTSMIVGLRDLTVEQRLNHGTQATELLPSALAGEVDIGGKRTQLTPLDVLFVRIRSDDGRRAAAALIDITSTAVAVRFSAPATEAQYGAVHDRKDRMPTLLEAFSRDSPAGTAISAVLASFGFFWGLRKMWVS
jgi:hypothetical protein